MKDFYYILGVHSDSSVEEIKKAHKKLSMKFHPDKNEGDEFFSERFKEIQAAYETLINPSKRAKYDSERSRYTNIKQVYAGQGSNFTPEIEFFRASKASFEYDEEITFSWKTINADKVSLKPFGPVPPIGQKTYKIKDFQNPLLTVELTAENSAINRYIRSVVNLKNETYEKLYQYFKNKIENEPRVDSIPNKAKESQYIEEANDKMLWILYAIGALMLFIIIIHALQ
ncbi:J domain-containing protein [Fibrella sp. HMF5335]|uniref:J domain-containing protein n=1 Tax=Fibrella rubiginis TaxID=2817060 RepID=A0A939GLU8_9BACT|nr:DnaJ domain-containing protein [Fibrella rubiginis]MBO0938748.1 J domain-containing protein [Fibrella rubiginis]